MKWLITDYHKVNDIPKNRQNVMKKDLIDSLYKCYENIAFSIFSYKNEKSSKKCLYLYKSGNCISLCEFLKIYLSNNYRIKSYIIPTTVPERIRIKGTNNITHVALCIPVTEKKYYIIDPAFNFLEPIEVNLDKINNKEQFFLKNVMENKKIKVNYELKHKKYYYVNCKYEDDYSMDWNYILKEIKNPDTTIGLPYIKNLDNEFFIKNYIENGDIKNEYYIKLKHNNLRFYFKGNMIYEGSLEMINLEAKNKLLHIVNYLPEYLFKSIFKYT